MHGYLHATHCAIQITNKRPRYKIMTLHSLATAFENIQILGQNLKKWFMYSKKKKTVSNILFIPAQHVEKVKHIMIQWYT